MENLILLRFLNTYGTHQANAGSSAIFLGVTDSAILIGLDYLASFNGIQLFEPYFHLNRIFHPIVVFL